MQVRNRGRNRAFTLVEILIVVVILGILAAIVVPQFTNAANDARGGNVTTQLQTLNNQTELFAARNNGEYPDFDADGWGDDATAGTMIGDDYLKTAPSNPAWNPDDNGGALATTVETVGAGVFGSVTSAWVFNTDTNTLYASYYDEVNGVITTTATD
ncbi:MAG: prepilin-type N-terminal cleavage/methylation domain-containing protein [Planctomycetota bacterium]|nr:MAG: prepilin-type N-terminal cleavage/methylation domain-containing protein [Planctomycetota bacterium]